MTITEQVREILSDEFDLDDVDLDDTLGDLGLDTIEIIEFVLHLSEACDIEIPDGAIEPSLSVAGVIAWVKAARGDAS